MIRSQHGDGTRLCSHGACLQPIVATLLHTGRWITLSAVLQKSRAIVLHLAVEYLPSRNSCEFAGDHKVMSLSTLWSTQRLYHYRWNWVVTITSRPFYPWGKSSRYPFSRNVVETQTRTSEKRRKSVEPTGTWITDLLLCSIGTTVTELSGLQLLLD